MIFTDQCDLFGAIHEQGINLVVQHIMCQRPSPTTTLISKRPRRTIRRRRITRPPT